MAGSPTSQAMILYTGNFFQLDLVIFAYQWPVLRLPMNKHNTEYSSSKAVTWQTNWSGLGTWDYSGGMTASMEHIPWRIMRKGNYENNMVRGRIHSPDVCIHRPSPKEGSHQYCGCVPDLTNRSGQVCPDHEAISQCSYTLWYNIHLWHNITFLKSTTASTHQLA